MKDKVLDKDNWKKRVCYYSKDWLLNNPMITYYDKNYEIVWCENYNSANQEFLNKINEK